MPCPPACHGVNLEVWKEGKGKFGTKFETKFGIFDVTHVTGLGNLEPLRCKNVKFPMTLVVPLHNEEAVVPELVQRLVGLKDNLQAEFRVVFVNDCSTDGTAALLHDLVDPTWMKIVYAEHHVGQHRALFMGLEVALEDPATEIIATMDADLSPGPEEFLRLLPYLSRHDLVIGRRETKANSPFRRIVSAGLTILSWVLRPTRIRDHGSMFRLYTRHLCFSCLELEPHGTFLAGISLLLSQNPVEIPVHVESSHAHIRGSKYSLPQVANSAIQMMRLLLRHPFGMGIDRE